MFKIVRTWGNGGAGIYLTAAELQGLNIKVGDNVSVQINKTHPTPTEYIDITEKGGTKT